MATDQQVTKLISELQQLGLVINPHFDLTTPVDSTDHELARAARILLVAARHLTHSLPEDPFELRVETYDLDQLDHQLCLWQFSPPTMLLLEPPALILRTEIQERVTLANAMFRSPEMVARTVAFCQRKDPDLDPTGPPLICGLGTYDRHNLLPDIVVRSFTRFAVSATEVVLTLPSGLFAWLTQHIAANHITALPLNPVEDTLTFYETVARLWDPDSDGALAHFRSAVEAARGCLA